ncbi:MAG: glycosyltransferase family 2 protein [Desulfuromonadales bacterium]|nr:glycosyltransferase family 2 protein [Desulfuromonadales bacterium]
MTPALSFLIVEYHCIDEVRGCLQSLRTFSGDVRWECVVVSNSEYSDAEFAAAERALDGARLLRNERNKGYAGGVNRGLLEVGAPYVFILNPDCRLVDGGIASLIDEFDRDPAVAVVGPRVIDGDGHLQPSCRRFPKLWSYLFARTSLRCLSLARREASRYFMEDFDHASARCVDWVSGGAMLVKLEAVREVGPMDERYFLYMEDVDWCCFFWAAGRKIKYVPFCTVVHDGQHKSLRMGLDALISPHFRFHVASIVKYFSKWRNNMPRTIERFNCKDVGGTLNG